MGLKLFSILQKERGKVQGAWHVGDLPAPPPSPLVSSRFCGFTPTLLRTPASTSPCSSLLSQDPTAAATRVGEWKEEEKISLPFALLYHCPLVSGVVEREEITSSLHSRLLHKWQWQWDLEIGVTVLNNLLNKKPKQTKKETRARLEKAVQ